MLLTKFRVNWGGSEGVVGGRQFQTGPSAFRFGTESRMKIPRQTDIDSFRKFI